MHASNHFFFKLAKRMSRVYLEKKKKDEKNIMSMKIGEILWNRVKFYQRSRLHSIALACSVLMLMLLNCIQSIFHNFNVQIRASNQCNKTIFRSDRDKRGSNKWKLNGFFNLKRPTRRYRDGSFFYRKCNIYVHFNVTKLITINDIQTNSIQALNQEKAKETASRME